MEKIGQTGNDPKGNAWSKRETDASPLGSYPKNAQAEYSMDDLFNRLVTEGILASHCDPSCVDNDLLVQ
jgi:hypothetical protein